MLKTIPMGFLKIKIYAGQWTRPLVVGESNLDDSKGNLQGKPSFKKAAMSDAMDKFFAQKLFFFAFC